MTYEAPKQGAQDSFINTPLTDDEKRSVSTDDVELGKVIEKDTKNNEKNETCRSQRTQDTLVKRPWRPRITSFEAIVAQDHRGSGTSSDPYLVQWLENDPEDPKTYSNLMKWSITMLVAMTTLSVSLASSAYTGAFEPLIRRFDASEEVIILGLSMFVLGFAVGPLLWAPLSEAIGRRHVLVLSFVIYTMWTGLCLAAQNVGTLIVFRFLAGTFGSSAFVVPGGQIADMFESEQRGIAMAAFAAAPFLGPTLGPLVGGYISETGGWQWVFGFLTLYAAVLTLLIIFFLPETYAPVLLRKRAKRLSQKTGKIYLTVMDAKRPLLFKNLVRQALVRPWALLFREPIVFILTIYTAAIYGTLYLCFGAFPIVYQQGRGWSAGEGGLAFLGILLGTLVGAAVQMFDNKRYVRHHKAGGGFAPPETRLPPAIFGGVAIIVGLAWFAATNSPNLHWLISIAAGVPFGAGFILVFMCCINYLIDSYVIYAASVVAANSTIRSAFGAAFPLFTTYMYKNLGIHWASAIPGFIALILFPFPILFYIYGAKIRQRCKYAKEAAEFLESLKSAK